MDDEVKLLKPNQEIALQALAAGSSITDAASKASVSEQTIHNWKKKPEFQRRLKDLIKCYSDQSVINIRALSSKAISALAESLDSKNENIKLKAIKIVLEANGVHKLDQELYILRDLGL